MSRTSVLSGNRMVLAGAVLYLLEWVAIIGAGVGVPVGAAATAHEVAAAYSGHADALGWAAGWFGVVELGRVLFMVGLRSSLSDSGRPHRLMDVAVVAMTVSVVLEVVSYTVVAGAAWSLAQGGSIATTRVLDAVAFEVNQTLLGPMGVSVLCAGIAMWRSGLYARTLSWLGLAAGGSFTVMGIALVGPRFAGAANAQSVAVLLLWTWMLWTGVAAWRARPRPAEAGTEESQYDLTTAEPV